MSLNIEQQAALEAAFHCLVIACPGSGKTKTVISKIANILRRDPEARIVAVTFTREAAQEMRERLAKEVPAEMLERTLIGTFHALAYRQLRTGGFATRVLAPHEQHAYLAQAMVITKIPTTEREEVLRQIENAKCSMGFDMHAPSTGNPTLDAYQASLHRVGALDMHDLLREAVRLMRQGSLPPLDCTHLMVDEFQDTDSCQYDWVLEHIHHGAITTAVADDDQSIYSWRRAMGFAGLERFVQDTSATRVTLSTNYRSRAEITSIADRVIHLNSQRMPKRMLAHRGAGGSVQLNRYPDRDAELDALGATVIAWCEDNGFVTTQESGEISYCPPAGSWAVLARNTYLLRAAHGYLGALGIVCRRAGRSLWEGPPVSTFLSAMELVANDSIIGFDALCHFSDISHAAQHSLHGFLGRDASRLFAHEPPLTGLSKPDAAAASRLTRRIREWRSASTSGRTEIAINGIEDYMKIILKEKQVRINEKRNAEADGGSKKGSKRTVKKEGSESPSGRDDLADLTYGDLPLAATIFRRVAGPLSARLARIASQAKNKPAREGLTLQTVHGSKGLEYSNVWVMGVDAEVFPAKKSDEDEERRLFYVAMTRAQDSLTVSSITDGKGPGRFFREAAG